MNKKRISKSPEQKLRDLESHLYFLWDARRLYPSQPERYKQLAAELRVLVCQTHNNKPLLLRLMKEYGFTYDVQPPGPPLDKSPIPMVGWRDDPEHKKLTIELERALGNDKKLKELLEKQAKLRCSIPFPEYVKKALSVYIKPYDYSYQDLVLAISQQQGSSHEDDTVEEPISKIQNVRIGSDQGHVAPLISFADLVIKVGSDFLNFLIDKYQYEPKCFHKNQSKQNIS